jgi:hypothetical protein
MAACGKWAQSNFKLLNYANKYTEDVVEGPHPQPVVADATYEVVLRGLLKTGLFAAIVIAFVSFALYSFHPDENAVRAVAVSGTAGYTALLPLSPSCACTRRKPLQLGAVASLRPTSDAYKYSFTRNFCSALSALQRGQLWPAPLQLNRSTFPSRRSQEVFLICDLFTVAEKQSFLAFNNVNVPFMSELVTPQELTDFAATALGAELAPIKTTVTSTFFTYSVWRFYSPTEGVEDTTPVQYFFTTEG